VRLAGQGTAIGPSSSTVRPSGRSSPGAPSDSASSAAASSGAASSADASAADPAPSAARPPAPAPTDPALAPFLAQLPVFGPPPAPQPITVPAGPTVPVYLRLPVTQPVAFLTIDDGWTQLPEAIPLMRAAHVPFSMFLIAPVAAKSPAFFAELESAGGVVEDHTISHPELRGRGYGSQRHEICDARTSLVQTFGKAPTLFRPPYGDYDGTTLRVAHDCGLKTAVDWSETVDSGTVSYQTPVHRIQPGDIILMHFRPAFVRDVIAALTAIHNAGLIPALLEDYLA
jgi:peptidoglycan/xylan/chitin deacetylase (PgdA/CDA1 family)